ncbi:hypothetical protein [Streptomyces sp. NPDC053542]|uniref:hypothetical protein n=1 Tax=Streptomyces sp. NPDC053542 TaxID=3365710 RepID=UPI0037D289BF
MDQQTKVTLAAAVIGGYVLGRTKKGRLALTAATYLAGRRFGLQPRQLAAEGMRRLGEIPQVAELQEQLRGEALDAGRKAVTAAANRSMASWADALSERTARLGSADDEAEEGEEQEGEEEDRGQGRDRDREPPKRAAKKAAKKAPAKKTAGARKSAAKKTAKKAPGKQKTGKQKTGTQETSSNRAAKKTASRAGRRR